MSIEKRRRRLKDGTLGPVSYRARYRSPDGKERSQSFARKIDAERFLTSVNADKLRGVFIDPQAGRQTFQGYAEEWRKVQAHEPSTAEQVESHLKNHVYPTLGHRPLGAIRKSEIQAWMKGREGELSAATVGTVFAWVRAVFIAAVEDQLIGRSPCVGVRPPKVDRVAVVPPTIEQVAAMIAAAPDRLRAAVVLSAGSGMRQGEVLGLTLERVEFLHRQVQVVEQMFTPSKGKPYLKRLKSERARRTIPVPAVVLNALTEHVAMFPPGDDGLVFTNSAGRPWRRPRFIEAFAQLVTDAGLTVTTGDVVRPLFTFHDLRHHYASVLIAGGESVKVVQERLGHASATETLDTYAHLWPDDEDRTRQVVQASLGAVFDAAQTRPTGAVEG